MNDLFYGNSMQSLFILNDRKSRRVSSYDKSGGNMDWVDIKAHEKKNIAEIKGPGVIRHIWCTMSASLEDGTPAPFYLRRTLLRIYWDGENNPSVEAPIGDFFGMGHGMARNFSSAAFAMSPQDGRGMCCYFPMPFRKEARVEIENISDAELHLYFYIDYEVLNDLPEESGYFHAKYNRERKTDGWADPVADSTSNPAKRGNTPGFPDWYPDAWIKTNTTGDGNYVILEAQGRGKYVGCNLNIDVFSRQANDWYGEGDDMIFIDGEPWPPNLHGTGTEDYFNTAFCPRQEFYAPYHGVTLYSGEKAGFPWGGKNSLYRLHILDPIHFKKSIKVTIEHGHANKLSNDYSSTAYWYQNEPHLDFQTLNEIDLIPRK